ncbi:MAG: DUF1294 domain-containing protein [Isosphaeraceae bacterium]
MIYLGLAYLTALAIAAAVGVAPWMTVAVYAAISLLAFIIYGWDKSSAKSGRWRTPEKTLHLLSLAGGWPGAMAGQQFFRHKTSKKSFQVVFWLTVVINIAFTIWVSSTGQWKVIGEMVAGQL